MYGSKHEDNDNIGRFFHLWQLISINETIVGIVPQVKLIQLSCSFKSIIDL